MKEHCRKVLEHVYLFLDGEVLSEVERLEIEAHLEECEPCYEYYGVRSEVTSVVSRLKGYDPCPDELRSRVEGILRSM